MEPVLEAHRYGFASPSALDQLALTELLVSGRFNRHLRRLRSAYRTRRDHMIRSAISAVPALDAVGTAAGLHFLLELPGAGPDEHAISAAAARQSVALACLGSHWHEPGDHTQGLIVGYSRPPAHAFVHAVGQFVAVLQGAAAATAAGAS